MTLPSSSSSSQPELVVLLAAASSPQPVLSSHLISSLGHPGTLTSLLPLSFSVHCVLSLT
eukprot:6181288-Pleurochrysis_carterae.AAC.1